MKPIDEALKSTNGYIKSFTRNALNGWWELEIGLPPKWIFDGNNEIDCEILIENKIGKLIRILPKNQNIVIDDLIKFVEIIIETNQRIVEKEIEFTGRMEEMKLVLENEAKKFYEELDELKINSFKNINDSFAKSLRPEEEKKQSKPKQKKDNDTSILDVRVKEIDTTNVEPKNNDIR